MTVTLIAAIAKGGVIGNGSAIPWRVPGEQRTFKQATLGHVLVMGRRTFEAIGRPLPGRTTVVVSRDARWQPAGGLPDSVRVAGTVEGALRVAAAVDEQVYVAGGAEIYAATLAVADRLRITWVDVAADGDVFFPDVDWTEWDAVDDTAHDGFRVVEYRRRGR